MTLLLGFAAVNTGNNLLYLLVSALLGFMIVSGILGRANLLRLEVTLDLPEEIYDGVETLVTVRVRNPRRRLPSFLLRVTVQQGAFVVRTLEPGVEARGTVPAVFRGRGRRPLSGARIASNFPVNFFVRSFALPVEHEILVFPAPLPSPLPAAETAGRTAGGTQERGRGEEGDLHRIDDYTGSEPLKRIHWKLSARQETLKVKQMSAAAREPLILRPENLPGHDMEEKLRRAVFLVNRLIGEQRPVGLHLEERRIPPACSPAHRLRLLRELALHGQA